ncbi:ABC-F family ATP-binding cassette domain-containing protein [Fodinicola feengrottensis]|uniref:ABC-F family ATP-binding cassette domain-containing protein n=1 Tax=Fodinicola feengrottensis TaxID=435914 RepID=UPI0031E3E2B9
MGHIEVSGLGLTLPDGRVLFDGVSFRVGDGAKVALVGANGTGKTTLLRIIAGDLPAAAGAVVSSGGLGVMRQFIGSIRDELTVGELLASLAPPGIRGAAERVEAAEVRMVTQDDEPSQVAYANALAAWGDAGGYDAEVLWDTVTVAALGIPYDRCRYRRMATLSGGEQKRLAAEALLRGPDEVLLLDEPDNYLDVPGKRWLEEQLVASPKTVLYVSHDRELLARTATRVITVEGGTGWTHPGGFGTYHDARQARHDSLDEQRRRWDEDHAKLKALVLMYRQKAKYNSDMASRLQSAKTRLDKFEEAGPPEAKPRAQNVQMRLRGGRTGKRALVCEQLELTGLMKPFNLEVFFGERVAVLGSNGSGKSHFLRLLAGGGTHREGALEEIAAVPHTGLARLGARVLPGLFAQTHDHPELVDRTLVDILWRGDDHRNGMDRHGAMRSLSRYELDHQGDQLFGTLSGGQQARFQILLLELAGATMLLLDEPTDNLDLHSAQALQDGLESFEGTVLAVTHDRWFARTFDRYLVFGSDGRVYESDDPVWDEGRVDRAR